jgi:hypothetical protein
MIVLVLTVCALNAPARCDEKRLEFIDDAGSLMQCMLRAPPTIAQWVEDHPGRRVTRWRCAYPGSDERGT